MDFDDILPILWLIVSIAGLILKRDKKENNKKNEIKKIKKEDKRIKGFPQMEKFKKVGDALKKEVHTIFEATEEQNNKGNHEPKIEIKDTKIECSNQHMERSHINHEKAITDVIKQNEIGKETILNKRNLVNGIIMSEILGKPKSLRR